MELIIKISSLVSFSQLQSLYTTMLSKNVDEFLQEQFEQACFDWAKAIYYKYPKFHGILSKLGEKELLSYMAKEAKKYWEAEENSIFEDQKKNLRSRFNNEHKIRI